jgi:hypothetical protein
MRGSSGHRTSSVDGLCLVSLGLVLDQLLEVQAAGGAVVEAGLHPGAADRAHGDQAGSATLTQFGVGAVLKPTPVAAAIGRRELRVVAAASVTEAHPNPQSGTAAGAVFGERCSAVRAGAGVLIVLTPTLRTRDGHGGLLRGQAENGAAAGAERAAALLDLSGGTAALWAPQFLDHFTLSSSQF